MPKITDIKNYLGAFSSHSQVTFQLYKDGRAEMFHGELCIIIVDTHDPAMLEALSFVYVYGLSQDLTSTESCYNQR